MAKVSQMETSKRIDSCGRVVLPSEFRALLGLETNSLVKLKLVQTGNKKFQIDITKINDEEKKENEN